MFARLAAASLSILCSAAAPEGATGIYRANVGDCRIASVRSAAGEAADGARSHSNAFVIEKARAVVVVHPHPMPAEKWKELLAAAGGDLTVVLTALDERQVGSLVSEGRPVFDTGLVVVAREPYEAALTSRDVETAGILEAYRRRGRLRLLEPNHELPSGVRFVIPRRGGSVGGQVRMSCGPATLMIVGIDDLATGELPAARSDPELTRRLASDEYTTALTDGRAPGIGHVYALSDGLHWGSLEARSALGSPLLRGSVTVEPDEAPKPAGEPPEDPPSKR